MVVYGKFISFNDGMLVYNSDDGLTTNITGVESISHIDSTKIVFELVDDNEIISKRDALSWGDYFVIEEYAIDGTSNKIFGIASADFDPGEDFCVYSICAFSLNDMSEFVNSQDNSYNDFLVSEMSSRICSIWDESTIIYKASDDTVNYINECLNNMGVYHHDGNIKRYIRRCPLNGSFYYISKYFDICKMEDSYSVECDRLYNAKNYFMTLSDVENALEQIKDVLDI